jgi:hypothetical protein
MIANGLWYSARVYENRLQISWIHVVSPSQNFVEVQWRSLFRSTSLGKRCTSYNVPPASRKLAADRWSLRNLLPQSSLFMVGKAQKSHGVRSELNSVFGLETVDRWNSIRISAIGIIRWVHELSKQPSYNEFRKRNAFRAEFTKPFTHLQCWIQGRVVSQRRSGY